MAVVIPFLGLRRPFCIWIVSQKRGAVDCGFATLLLMKKAMMVFGLVVGMASAQVDVSVAGLQVVDKGYKPEGDGENKGKELRAFNWNSGSRVALLLESKGKSIVGLDERGSTSALISR